MAISAAKQAEIKKLREERKALVAKAREIQEKADAEGRAMRSDEEGAWEDVMKKVDEMHERVSRLERMAEAEADDEDEDRDDEEESDDQPARDDEGGEDDEEDDEEEDEDKERSIIRNGKRYVLKKTPKRRTVPGGKLPSRRMPWESENEFRTRQRRSTPEYNQVFWDYAARGDAALQTSLARRAIQADSDIVGGYLVAPQEFVGRLIKFVNNFVFIRQRATKYTLKAAQSLGAPSLDTDISDSDWTSELDTGNEDQSMAFGKRELTPRPLAKRIKVSNRLLRMASVTGGFSADNSVAGGGPEGLIRDRLGYKFGVTEEEAFMTGDGTKQPLGVFTASTRGIDTSRDVLTGNSTGITVDALINAQYNQKVQYWPRCEWIFNRAILSYIRKLKDANGQYLWVPGGMGGEADTILGRPVNMSEYAPSVFSSGNYVGLFGDLSFYWIADSETLEIQRLVELYAAANQTGFIARMELDGMPVLAEAFTRLKCN